MPAHRMDRNQFHAKLAGRDAEQLGKILWTLYWRGSAPMRQRIEAQLDPDEHARGQRREQTLPDAAAVADRVREFAELARAGAYLAGDRRVSPRERSRWRFTFRDLADDAQTALAAEDVEDLEVAAAALELLVDLACETRGYEYFRSEDPMQAAGFVVSDAAAALWRAVRERHGFAAFAHRAPAQLLRWESRYGWTRTGDGKVAQQETSLATVVDSMLSAPDHWRAFVTRYLEALEEAADRAAAATRRWSAGAGREPRERARALAEWHTMLPAAHG